ncbi:DUF7312 domain-containing protein [Salinigranum rubrum]|uniref:DUF7312 domain-containing protein n=1 Tax=Salinigranum rubrum TaxID=755307 RepID=UPI001FE9EC0C|nr:hypothetical protein [Salinigranum rubrum]
MVQSGPDSDSVETTDDEAVADSRDHEDERVNEHEGEGEDDEWEFGLDEVGPDGVVESEPEPLEPGQPTLENTVFVLLGVVGTLLLLSTVI